MPAGFNLSHAQRVNFPSAHTHISLCHTIIGLWYSTTKQVSAWQTSSHVMQHACCVGKVRQLEEAEQLAVEQEDFESAASMSSELDNLR